MDVIPVAERLPFTQLGLCLWCMPAAKDCKYSAAMLAECAPVNSVKDETGETNSGLSWKTIKPPVLRLPHRQ